MGRTKGEYGYLKQRKSRALIGTVGFALIGIVIYVIGLLLNKMSNQNIFTIFAVLFVLPMTKQLVRVIVLFPYHPITEERFQRVSEKLPEGMELMTDLVITSSEKVMHLDFLAVGNRQVVALLGKEKQDISYVRKYLADGVACWGANYKVKIVDSEKIFLQELASVPVIGQKEESEENSTFLEEEETVKSYLTSLII